MKVPGTPGRRIDNPLSPTFREEQMLEKQEEITEKEQAKDLKVKTRVRMAKFMLRGVNFACSLIVLSMISATMTIFNSTRDLGTRNGNPPWAPAGKTWPQYVTLSCACVSLALSLAVFYSYWRGGHKRAEKTGVYYTLFAIGFFIFNTIMWAIAAGILQGSKNSSNNKDIWGWACVNNQRRTDFQQDVNYALVCRLQNWSLVCCIIEIVVETITIAIYSVIFYRYYSKRKLRRTMEFRDRARSDLYLAQLRTQSAPNTPGFGPMSPSYAKSMASPRFPQSSYSNNKAFDYASIAEEGTVGSEVYPNTRFVEAKPSFGQPKPFALQAPPIRVHAPAGSGSGSGSLKSARGVGFAEQRMGQEAVENRIEHAPMAPGEQTYAAVPIPGAYASTVPAAGAAGFGMAVTSDRRIDSPPGSPRRF